MIFSRLREITSHTYFPIILLVVVNLVLGAYIVTNYGESWDEQPLYRYADKSLLAYSRLWEQTEINVDGPSNIKYYGPFYLILGKFFVNLIQALPIGWLTIEIWHFLNFCSFQIALFSLYIIGKRFFNTWVAFSLTLLFSTQPLIWGHAFINPKDIPFMAFFLASIAAGMAMVDSFVDREKPDLIEEARPFVDKKKRFLSTLSHDWAVVKRSSKKTLLLVSGLWLGILATLLLSAGLIRNMIAELIASAYYADPSTMLGMIFSRLAENVGNTPIYFYVQKAQILYQRFEYILLLVTLLPILLAYGFLLNSTVTLIWDERVRPYLNEIQLNLPKKIISSLINKRLVFAGILLGLCISIRVIGPAAGGLIAIYFLSKIKHKSVAPLIAYFSTALITTYITWPYLWDAPISRLFKSFTYMSKFPLDVPVLFNGIIYSSKELPNMYLPTLMILQFTEPILLLLFASILFSGFKFWRGARIKSGILIISLWLFIPIIMAIILQPVMYNNFRQFLFITPPIFILAGISLETLFKKIKNKWSSAIILLVMVLPGIYWGVNLHPYEYVYYNSIEGGVQGVFRNYELDYWNTSFKEATNFINEMAPLNARVIVWGATDIVRGYARQDLIVTSSNGIQSNQINSYDFAIISTRANRDLINLQNTPLIFSVGKEGTIFVIVREINQ